jgi:glycosyltransferase involved in cell wall biosynthesis
MARPLLDTMSKRETIDCGLIGESIVCFAGEDWWYHHPHSKNHILKRLAKQNRVLFVNSITMGLPSLGNPDLLLKIRRKLKSYMRWLRRVPEGLWVLTPINVPFYGFRLIRSLNRVLLVLQLRLAMLLCRISHPVLWVAIPTAADIVDDLGAKLVLYQVSDKYEANEDSALSREVIREMDRRLKTRAAMVMYSGRKLFEEAEVPHRYYLEQAVDFDHFANPSAEIAPDVASIARPVLAYFGYMDYVMDTALIEEVARSRPDWHWVLIGRRSKLVEIRAPNVHFLGPKSYGDLPKYIGHIDVFVLPWRHDNVFTSYGSAIKVREYLATGKPVVISPLHEYLNTPGVRIYRTKQEFLGAVEDALEHDTASDRQLRQSVVRDSTWDARAQDVGRLIAKLLSGCSWQELLDQGRREPTSASDKTNWEDRFEPLTP